ncbi:solute carrier family 22 member 6 [Dermacentor silvarum]|uniref:solute carrier family 22 member 6 n=1 Tax=Dermacentor silvarum TaxID=543639 RepID=UPI0021009F09|nr:solute carrier family 22 member 6 [Dermacentor silvarum]
MEHSLWRRYLLLDLETSDCFDNADVIGDGFFQVKIMLLCVVSLAILHSHTLAFALISFPVDHWCRPPAHLGNLSEAGWRNVGIPLEANGQPSSCRMYDALNSTAETIACDAWDYSADRAASTIVSQWNLVCHRAWLLHAAKAAHLFGAAVATAAAGYFADHAGRKPVINAATTMLLLVGCALRFADSYVIYLAMRFLLGGAASTLFVVTNILYFEVSPNDCRTRRLGMAVLMAFGPCVILFLLLRETRLNWMQLQMAMGSPTALAPLFFVLAVESPRWLVATKQFDQAEAVVASAAKANGFAKPADAAAAIKRLKSVESSKVNLKVTLLAVLSIGLVRHRVTTVFASSFATTFAYYALTPTAGLTRAWGGPVSLVATTAVFLICLLVFNRVSRLLMVSVNLSALACCSCLASLMFRMRQETLGRVFLVFARAFSVSGMMVNYIYVLEHFPTPIRGVFSCTSYAFGRIGATFTAFYGVAQEDSLLGFVVFVVLNVVLLLLRIRDENETPAEPTTAPPGAKSPTAEQRHGLDRIEGSGGGEVAPARKAEAPSCSSPDACFRALPSRGESANKEPPTVTVIATTTCFH